MPAVNYFRFPLWRRLLDRVLREEGARCWATARRRESSYCGKLLPAIWRSRGIRCEASQIVITEGALEGVNLCTHLLSVAGDTAWVEEPAIRAKSIFLKSGLHIEGVPVDHEGMRFDSHNDSEAPRLIFTSPSHQYPCGA
jgi:GntR family transcriptional regulator/MocR family aminotransferase